MSLHPIKARGGGPLGIYSGLTLIQTSLYTVKVDSNKSLENSSCRQAMGTDARYLRAEVCK